MEVFYKKGVLKIFAIFTGKHLCQSLFLIKKSRQRLFNRTPPADCFWNKCTCENLKPKLFHLRLLASLCNFNYLQIFVKAKFTVVKYNSKIIIYHQIKFRKRYNGQVFYKKTVPRNFAIFIEKHLCWSLFLIKMQAFSPETLLKSGSNTAIFL